MKLSSFLILARVAEPHVEAVNIPLQSQILLHIYHHEQACRSLLVPHLECIDLPQEGAQPR